MKKLYRVRAWGGFINNRLDRRVIDTGFGGWGKGLVLGRAIYNSKKAARKEYEDVRLIEVRELKR